MKTFDKIILELDYLNARTGRIDERIYHAHTNIAEMMETKAEFIERKIDLLAELVKL